MHVAGSPIFEVASPPLAARSRTPACMVVSSWRAMRYECLLGLLFKYSLHLIAYPLRLNTVLLPLITRLSRLTVWSLREHAFGSRPFAFRNGLKLVVALATIARALFGAY